MILGTLIIVAIVVGVFGIPLVRMHFKRKRRQAILKAEYDRMMDKQ